MVHPGVSARLTTPSQRPRGPRDPRRRPCHSPKVTGGRRHTPLTPARCPHAPPLGTLPPCHTHATSSNSTLARTVRIDDRMRFGAQQQGIVSTPRSVLAFALYLQCVTSATEANAKSSSPQLRRPRRIQGLLRYAGGLQNKVAQTRTHQGAPKTQGISRRSQMRRRSPGRQPVSHGRRCQQC